MAYPKYAEGKGSKVSKGKGPTRLSKRWRQTAPRPMRMSRLPFRWRRCRRRARFRRGSRRGCPNSLRARNRL